MATEPNPELRTGARSLHAVVKLPASAFTNEKCAENNRVFLWENHDTEPHLRPVKGWKIIGYGQAPWPGSSNGFAVMLEKTTPAEEKDNIFAKEHIRFDEGTRIWQHLCERHFRELNDKSCAGGEEK
jgi:hypothetical protein